MPGRKPLLEIKGLRTQFLLHEGTVTALDGIDLTIYENESVGIVGETGCGKSMTAFSVLRLVPPPGKITAGSIRLKGVELITLTENQMRGVRGRRISMVFQDPSTALDPVFNIGSQLGEVISLHQNIYDKAVLKKKTVEILKLVKIAAPESVLKQYPHELSGGMKQRVMIALALSCNPLLLIADEPTTALDVTIQAQILNLLKEVVKVAGSSMMIITHNLGVVAETCDRVCIMYAGRIVEIAETFDLFGSPLHPYTKGLLTAFPKLGERKEELAVIRGTVPNLMKPFPGCPFVDRCDYAVNACSRVRPWMVEVGPGHFVACHLYPAGGGTPDGV
ncbi:MAG: ABC transporter ATP-binding protein [Thermoplasmatota archaeon]|nr:ABC transporter ATP-binding protein [Candidatus Thermoplasmatota archaeon]MBU1913902.1 ABC transporter ATP-binding protein [Candidatus Thermoplasmatota archaeon]